MRVPVQMWIHVTMADDHKVSVDPPRQVCCLFVTNAFSALLRPLYLSQLSSWQLGLLEKAVAPPNRLPLTYKMLLFI